MSNSGECVFCPDDFQRSDRLIVANDLAFAIWDLRPKAPGHSLVIPRAHRDNYFDITEEEIGAILELSKDVKTVVDDQFGPEGYNVISNVGKAAGQVVMHAHLHLVPRYPNDNALVIGDHNRPDLSR